jgi:carboxyl-terminal processing protease
VRFSRSALLPGLLIGLLAGLAIASWLSPFEDGEDVGEDALEVIESDYWQSVDPDKLRDSSIEGMIDELRRRYEDPFSHYFDPRAAEDLRQATSGRFEGIGLAVTQVKNGLRVAQVYENAPADEAGIEKGDVIVAVEGDSIAGEPAEASTARIKGPPGTEVEITVRDEDGGRRELTVERAEVRIPAVRATLRRTPGDEKVGYVEFRTFTRGAHGELRTEIERVAREGAEGIVLDLRGNGGGFLNEAILATSIFVEDGVVASTEGRTSPKQTYEATGDALPERPMVVLINRDTASAAEILASALKDYELATIVGTRSFGKGTFQEMIDLEDGGALNLTVGEYLNSEGKSLADRGVTPQVRAVDRPRTEPDEALDRALAALGRELN